MSLLRVATLENFTIDPKMREQTFPSSGRRSMDSIDSMITTKSTSSKLKLLWSKSG
jgi:hypothetical protein